MADVDDTIPNTLASRSLQGPLAGLKILEIEGLGGAPFAAMLLADLGAQVLRVERHSANDAAIGGTDPGPTLGRGRAGLLRLDLKSAAGLASLKHLIVQADGLIESFRPGVAERLGFGPDVAQNLNPRLIYGRLTGWGRAGPLAPTAGHDINYIALAGLLGAIGRPESPPSPPLAIGGDMGGGGMFLALGMLAAFFERNGSGRGQVVDAAMLHGATLLSGAFADFHARGHWSGGRGGNLTDGGAPFYDSYYCADGLMVAVGALEPKFFAILCDKIGIDQALRRQEPEFWPALRHEMTRIFAAKPQAYWVDLCAGSDACLTPVLDFSNAPEHPQNQSVSFTTLQGQSMPKAGPSFSRTPPMARIGRRDLSEQLRRDWKL